MLEISFSTVHALRVTGRGEAHKSLNAYFTNCVDAYEQVWLFPLSRNHTRKEESSFVKDGISAKFTVLGSGTSSTIQAEPLPGSLSLLMGCTVVLTVRNSNRNGCHQLLRVIKPLLLVA